MRSVRICISCEVLAKGIISVHCGNISMDVHIVHSLTDVYFKVCIVILEKQALS